MNLFNDAFASANQEWERIAGELFLIDGAQFTAIAIEDLNVEKRAMLGGIFSNAATRILVSAGVKVAGNIAKGTIISIRGGVRLRVTNEPVDTDGDNTYWLACGSV